MAKRNNNNQSFEQIEVIETLKETVKDKLYTYVDYIDTLQIKVHQKQIMKLKYSDLKELKSLNEWSKIITL